MLLLQNKTQVHEEKQEQTKPYARKANKNRTGTFP